VVWEGEKINWVVEVISESQVGDLLWQIVYWLVEGGSKSKVNNVGGDYIFYWGVKIISKGEMCEN
jgi:hypothetical protein